MKSKKLRNLLVLTDPAGFITKKSNKTCRIKKIQQVMFCLLFVSCQQNYTPKPHAYYRIDFPEREYRIYESGCPFTFEYPVYGTIIPLPGYHSEPCWLDVSFSKYKGTIHLTYKEIDNNFDQFFEDNWKMIFKGLSQKADAIDDRSTYENHEQNVFGTLYLIGGNAASSTVFYATDSVRHFLRGALYFYVRPNHDSLAPVVNFFREDVIHLMETIRWKSKTI